MYEQFLLIVKHLQDETMPVPDVLECARTLLQARPGLFRGFKAMLPIEYRLPTRPSEESGDFGNPQTGKGKGRVVVIDLETPEPSETRVADNATTDSWQAESIRTAEELSINDSHQQCTKVQQSQERSVANNVAPAVESQSPDDAPQPSVKAKSRLSSKTDAKKQKRKKSERPSEHPGDEASRKAKKRKVVDVKAKEPSVSVPA